MNSRSIRCARDIGVEIHRIRKSQRLTQAQLARMAGIRQATVSAVENGRKGSDVTTIFRMLHALNLEFRMEPRKRAAANWFEELV